MVSVISLWLPILLSAVLVFVVSSIVHMVLPYHRSDFSKVPAEDQMLTALRPLGIPPGDYIAPHAGTMEGMKAPEYVDKVTKGPILLMTVLPSGMPTMGKSLLLWFLYTVVVGIFSGYLAGITIPAGEEFRLVFRVVAVAAFMGYGLALAQNSIWYKRRWSTTCKSMFDSLIYALVTAGTFGWLWPAAV